MKRSTLCMTASLSALSILIHSHARATPSVSQSPPVGPNSPQVWELTQVGDPIERRYNLRVWEHPNPAPSPGTLPRITTVSITKGATGLPFTIERLTVLAPQVVDSYPSGLTRPRKIIVALGQNGTGTRAQKINEIIVENGGVGYVGVQAYSDTTLGSVSEVNNFTAEVFGDVIGPISLRTFYLTDRSFGVSDPYPSSVSLTSIAGSLLADVIAHPSAPFGGVGGAVDQLDFASGRIGPNELSPIRILADARIKEVFAQEINARFLGTDIVPSHAPVDSYVSYIARIRTNTENGGSGKMTGEIRAEFLALDPLDDIQSDPVFEIAGDMKARIWLQQIPSKVLLDYAIFMNAPRPAGPDLLGRIVLGALSPPSQPDGV